ncbi:transposase [Bradyrhizobium pachyrhizi]|uniref:transposase n=1 Tax=Bradyrhizobium pachyrhizi TaxID=280333 RepID=UPI0024B275B6|nr:transposase [Bradyrhizobium pachyrhizi]WFU53612.1 transposase [Bradyrhizobium pachyrhizi]
MSDLKIRPFAADMPKPIEGESLLGLFSRALERTAIDRLKRGLALAGVQPFGNPSGVSISEKQADALAILFKVDREDIVRRLHPRGSFDHRSTAPIDFFGTKLRTQYLETIFRRVSPRALALSPYHRAIWDLRPLCFDPTTRERLLVTCPVCGEKLRWWFVRGPTHCETCVTDRGFPKTDLRDFPQPLLEFGDEEAIDFVVDLVNPDPKKREVARTRLPAELAEASNSDVFEAVIAIASCFRPEFIRKTIFVGRPLRAGDFEGFTPDLLEIAGRMIIGGRDGFAAGTARLRARMSERKAAHGLFAEVGPLAGTVNDRSLAPVVRAFLVESLQRDLTDTSELGLVRRRLGTVKPKSGGPWLNMQQAHELFGVSKHALQRLAGTGMVETRRADTEQSPVLMNRDEIAPFAALYKDAMDEIRAKAALRISTAELHELADRGVVERIEEPVKSMLDSKTVFRASSVNALLMAIKKRAAPADPARSIRNHLWNAARRLPSPVPWTAIIELILSGDIKVELLRDDGNEWRKWVAPADIEAFETLVRLEQAKRPAALGAWVTRIQAAEMLNVAESSVWKVARAGFLHSKREGRGTVYRRSDVAAAARKFIFLPEMLERSPFKVEHEVGRWLKSVGIEPLSEWSKSVFPIYGRASFERVVSSLPPAIEDVEIEERAAKRVPTDVRRKAVAEVKTGLSVFFVARRLGVSAKALTAWVAHYNEHGEVPPAGKLDGHEDYIRSAIEADPSVSIHAFWQAFKKDKVKVGYTIMSKFIADLGYERDAAGRLVRRSVNLNKKVADHAGAALPGDGRGDVEVLDLRTRDAAE